MIGRLRARLHYVVRTTWSGLRTTPWNAGVAVLTIALCLLLIGAFLLLLANMERILDRFGQEFRVTAYLEDGLPEQAIAELRQRLAHAPGVERVVWVSKAEALERFRASASGRAALLEGLEENPLPASLELVLAAEDRSRAGIERLATALEGIPGIAELGYGAEWVEGYGHAVGLVRGVALALGGVLVLATLLIVTNTIRLALYARRDEVEILELVGGSRLFVALPYLLEGLVQGALGGLLGLLLLLLLFQGALPIVAGSLELLLGNLRPEFLAPARCFALVAVGAGLGLVGSAGALLQGRLGR